jgi:hypothetical protein
MRERDLRDAHKQFSGDGLKSLGEVVGIGLRHNKSGKDWHPTHDAVRLDPPDSLRSSDD